MKITTFRLMVLLCVVMTSTNALAEARAPKLVITAFIEALHNYDMAYLMQYVDLDKIQGPPKHGYTAATLKTIFSDIQMSEIELSKPTNDRKAKIIRVRMKRPLSFDIVIPSLFNTSQKAILDSTPLI